jgi:DNA-binding HxlR family transcriptional regulator
MLKTLEEKGIISRRIVEARPPRVEYTLTERGKEVVGLLRTLSQVI